MHRIATGRCILPLLLLCLTLGASQLLGANCDQPVVVFQAGQLSVSSNGCSLQQNLNAIARQTGVEISAPASASTVPVFAVVGPGNPARVISELLDGSPFNCTLTAKADGQGELVRVVLTERVAFVPDKAPSPAAATDPAKQANRPAERSLQARADDLSDPNPQRKEIDDETLKKLPPLPPGVPAGMWQAFPSIVANGGVVSSEGRTLPGAQGASSAAPGSNSNSASYPLLNGSVPYNPETVPRGAMNLPPLPPGIDPNIGRLYPWNLMDLIHNRQSVQMPTIQLPPPPPMVPWH